MFRVRFVRTLLLYDLTTTGQGGRECYRFVGRASFPTGRGWRTWRDSANTNTFYSTVAGSLT